MSQEKQVIQKEQTTPEKTVKLNVLIPSVDIYENTEEYLLYVDIPGVNREDISIDLDNGQLTLTGTVANVPGVLTVTWSGCGTDPARHWTATSQ